MQAQLILHEGLRLEPYVDTEMNWTIGVGYNITGRGWVFFEQAVGRKVASRDGMTEKVRITKDEALLVLRADIVRIDKAIPKYFPAYVQLDEVRQRVCLDLAFNMGHAALSFKNTMAAITARDWSKASRNLWLSKWAGQVGDGPGKHWDRADRLTQMLLTGVDYTV